MSAFIARPHHGRVTAPLHRRSARLVLRRPRRDDRADRRVRLACMALALGVFVVPNAHHASRTLEQIVAADETGLDLAGIQDHPYQRRYLETWTLMSFAAARTSRLRFVTDVANVPLRLPAVLAKAA